MTKFIETEKLYFIKGRAVGQTNAESIKLYKGTEMVEVGDTEEGRIAARLTRAEEVCEGGSCKVDLPFGKDWSDTMMNWSKKDLVGFLKRVLEEKQQVRESEIMLTLIEFYGIKAQIIKALGELAELSTALNHNFFENKIDAVEVVKEIADVEIICKSLRVMFGEELVNIAKANTYDRLEVGAKAMREKMNETLSMKKFNSDVVELAEETKKARENDNL